jgi:hypothetical protein
MKSPLEQNYYELLEVPRDATLAEIDRAYDRARAYYGEGSVAVYSLASPEDLKRVQDRTDEAYLILADEKARAEYDARIGPPGPDERPLHREVRLAREKDEAKKDEARKEAERAQEKAAEAAPATPREPTPAPMPAVAPPSAPEPAIAVAEPAPTLAAAAAVVEPAAVAEPAPEPVVAKLPTPPRPMHAVEGPIPPPPMAFPEPTPRAPAPTPAKRDGRPPETSPKPAPVKPDVGADTVFSGELLRRVREGAGLSLQEIADRTKIGRTHLESIETDRYEALPAHVYLRGFLMSFARELRLDPLRVSRSYLEQMASNKGKAGAKPRS